MPNSIIAFLPCRSGSERIPRKNTRPFARLAHGLLENKLTQLSSCSAIDKIILSTNDETILKYSKSLDCSKLFVHHRPDDLATSTTSTDQLIKLAHQLIPSGHVFWTHVTSPFVTASICTKIISCYFQSLSKGYDSLMTATPFRGFLWDEHGPLNYDRSIFKWPRTQTLKPLYEVNSAVFLAPSHIYANSLDRIGTTPYLYELDRFTGLDIDWEEDFMLAEQLLSLDLVSL